MTGHRSDLPDHLTFSQRYGYEPLPKPMRQGEISDDLRREIWSAVLELLSERRIQFAVDIGGGPTYRFNENDTTFFERVFYKFLKTTKNNTSMNYETITRGLTKIIFENKFNRILDLIEIIINDKEQSNGFTRNIKKSFEEHAAAYWLDTSRRPYWFVPCASKEQGEASQKAIERLHERRMDGAATHMRQAAEHINARQYADSIADSIHAVESVARIIDPNAGRTLGPALDSLETAGVLRHKALKEAFKKLYGYTSDEQGVRHALTDQDTAKVGIDEAIFMFGACAAFAAYLTAKHQQVEEREAR